MTRALVGPKQSTRQIKHVLHFLPDTVIGIICQDSSIVSVNQGCDVRRPNKTLGEK